MAQKISLLLLSHSSSRLNSMENIFVDQGAVSLSRKLLGNPRDINQSNISLPDAVILDLGDEWQQDLSDYGNTQPAQSNIPLLVIGHSNDSNIMRAAMQAGARDYFYSPISADELVSAAMQIGSATKQKKRTHSGSITVLINGKGGSGASFLTTGLAAALDIDKKRDSASCIVVDLDLQFGTMPVYFDLPASDSLSQALQGTDQLDAIAIQGMVQSYQGSNIGILSSQPEGIRQHSVEPAANIQNLLHLLASSYNHVIVDTPRHFDPNCIGALECADQIMMVMQQSVSHIRDTRYLMGLIKSLGVSNRTIKLIVNRYEKSNSISLSDVKGAFQDIEHITIPNDHKHVSASLNDGIPLPFKWPNSAIGKALSSTADHIWPIDEKKPQGSALRRLFG